MSYNQYTVYVDHSEASIKVVEAFVARGLNFLLKNIREDAQHLSEFLGRGVDQVPLVVDHTGRGLGGVDQILDHVGTATPPPMPVIPVTPPVLVADVVAQETPVTEQAPVEPASEPVVNPTPEPIAEVTTPVVEEVASKEHENQEVAP